MLQQSMLKNQYRYNIDTTLTFQHSTLQYLSNILSMFCAVWGSCVICVLLVNVILLSSSTVTIIYGVGTGWL